MHGDSSWQQHGVHVEHRKWDSGTMPGAWQAHWCPGAWRGHSHSLVEGALASPGIGVADRLQRCVALGHLPANAVHHSLRERGLANAV